MLSTQNPRPSCIPGIDFLVNSKTGRVEGVRDPTGRRDTQFLEDGAIYARTGTRRYVDFRTAANGGKGSNNNDGLSKDTPYATMAFALAACSNYDSIGIVGGVCTESGLSSSLVGIRIYGMGPQSGSQIIWKPSASAIALTMTGKGWLFDGFKAEPAPGNALIYASRTSGALNPADGMIVDVEVNGGGLLLDAVDVDNWRFYGIHAHDMDTAVIRCQDGEPKRWHLAGNRFYNNANHVIARLNDSEVEYNSFQAQGVSITCTTKLDLRGGAVGRNLVHDNFVGGTFSNVGGYFANANDEWGRNWNNGGVRDGRPA